MVLQRDDAVAGQFGEGNGELADWFGHLHEVRVDHLPPVHDDDDPGPVHGDVVRIPKPAGAPTLPQGIKSRL